MCTYTCVIAKLWDPNFFKVFLGRLYQNIRISISQHLWNPTLPAAALQLCGAWFSAKLLVAHVSSAHFSSVISRCSRASRKPESSKKGDIKLARRLCLKNGGKWETWYDMILGYPGWQFDGIWSGKSDASPADLFFPSRKLVKHAPYWRYTTMERGILTSVDYDYDSYWIWRSKRASVQFDAGIQHQLVKCFSSSCCIALLASQQGSTGYTLWMVSVGTPSSGSRFCKLDKVEQQSGTREFHWHLEERHNISQQWPSDAQSTLITLIIIHNLNLVLWCFMFLFSPHVSLRYNLALTLLLVPRAVNAVSLPRP